MSVSEATQPIDLATESDFSLGRAKVRPSSREVISPAGVETLEPRVMQVLVALARRRGTAVAREQLIEECWAGRIVGEDAISRCIARLRRFEADAGFVVETIARIGYRLTEEVPPSLAPTPAENTAMGNLIARNRLSIIAGCVALVLAISGVTYWRSLQRQAADFTLTLTDINDLVSKDRFGEAFTRAYQYSQEEHRRKDPRFAELWRQVILPMKPLIADADATVYFKPYGDIDGDWIKAGVTPLEKPFDAPRGPLRLRVEKDGYQTAYFTVANPGPSVENERSYAGLYGPPISPVHLRLAANGEIPDDMVLVPHTNIPVFLAGWSSDFVGSDRREIPEFAMARDEVTNKDFKEFIDAGGYSNPKYWEGLPFTEDGMRLSWEEARKKFIDASGRPGPSGWQFSTYPDKQERLPVGGVSWYEAMAYAHFRGQQLPTVHHWVRAAFSPYDPRFATSPAISSASHYAAGTPTSNERGLGPWGTYHMLGNLREWVSNFADGRALALGGAWSDYASESPGAYTQDPMERTPENGLRLMQADIASGPTNTSIQAELLKPIRLDLDNPERKRSPLSNEAFAAMRFQFTASRQSPLKVHTEQLEQTLIWSAEEVTLSFKDEETVILYVVRPNTDDKRLQPIVYSPPQDCCGSRRPNRTIMDQMRMLQFIPNSGRALIMPVWAGSYERFRPRETDVKARDNRDRELALNWYRDLSVTLDYLESRADIDSEHIGYLGISRGASYTGALMLAVEERIKVAVLVSGGIPLVLHLHPMADIVNYAPHIKQPVLMLNGRFDHFYAYETSQRRLFDLLGTPPDRKKHVVLETGHFFFPSNSLPREASNWFDEFLGPTR